MSGFKMANRSTFKSKPDIEYSTWNL